MKDQYRIREYKGCFTIEKKRIIKQFRLMLPAKIVEQWEGVDTHGNLIDRNIPTLEVRRLHVAYTSLKDATDAMNQLIEGVKYHYSNERTGPIQEGSTKSNLKKGAVPRMRNPPPPPKGTKTYY